MKCLALSELSSHLLHNSLKLKHEIARNSLLILYIFKCFWKASTGWNQTPAPNLFDHWIRSLCWCGTRYARSQAMHPQLILHIVWHTYGFFLMVVCWSLHIFLLAKNKPVPSEQNINFFVTRYTQMHPEKAQKRGRLQLEVFHGRTNNCEISKC